ncbi:shikimate dehydrogenase [Deinococcus sonorensis]|uniref:Shikimate dehydrogenase n=2 Tax=Deinococcus sonorensis TaxID=309891 RepID=A0AAU7U865_9DEIO
MSVAHDTPLALFGYPPQVGRSLRDLGLTAVTVPPGPLPDVLEACATLRYSGALVHPTLQAELLGHAEPDSAARRAGLADALAFAGGVQATYTLPDALLDALEQSGYPVRGARALLLGVGADLQVGVTLTRLGLSSVTLAASTRPLAEQLGREVPAGLLLGAVSRSDPALPGLAERADLIVLTAGSVPAGLLQPFHAVLDLTGRAGAAARQAGATLVPLAALPVLRLARRLLHATGVRFVPDALEPLTTLLD